MYEQRSGTAVGLPYTRFAHSADHTAPASVPVPDTSPAFAFTWSCIRSYTSQVTPSSPPLQSPQSAPALTSNETSLYPFGKHGHDRRLGGHWDAELPLALAELGLIDEYELVVHPRLAGHGPTLFAGLSKHVDLKLVSRLEFGSGAVAMRYEPRR